MTTLENPVATVTREQIVNVLLEHLEGRIHADKQRLVEERKLYDHSAEPDRDEAFEHRRLVSSSVRTYEGNIEDNKIFMEFLKGSKYSPSRALSAGNIMLTEIDGERQAWIIYDPGAPDFSFQKEISLSVDKTDLLKDRGIDEVMTVSLTCPLVKRIIDKDIREGAFITVGVEANDSEDFRVEKIL